MTDIKEMNYAIEVDPANDADMEHVASSIQKVLLDIGNFKADDIECLVVGVKFKDKTLLRVQHGDFMGFVGAPVDLGVLLLHMTHVLVERSEAATAALADEGEGEVRH